MQLQEELEGINQRAMRTGNPRSSGILQSMMSTVLSGFSFANKSIATRTEPGLPHHQTQISAPVPPRELLYLLVCAKEGGGASARRLRHLDLRNIKSDEEFFACVRDSYWGMRGKYHSLFSLRTLKRITFIRLQVHIKGVVNVLKEHDMPPEEKKTEYRFAPVPAEVVPPIAETDLMHYFHHPHDADDGFDWCLSRFPKRLHEKLRACPRNGPGEGWGIHFVEDWDLKKLWMTSFLICGLGSFAFGVLWAYYENSIQDAFAISSYMIAMATLSIGTVQAMLHMN
jgi:hypothetical protein